MRTESRFPVFTYIILLGWAFLCLYPLLWMVGASLKAPEDVLRGSLFPAGTWHWDTYVKVWEKMDFFKYFSNSVMVTALSIFGIILLYSLAGFAFALLRFRGREWLFYGFLSLMFVPGMTILIPLYITEYYLGLLNTFLGLVLPSVNGAAPFAIFLFRNYFRSIPYELFESARVDGFGILKILFTIYLPLSLPAVATISIMNFLGIWNNLVLPMTLLTEKSLYTLPIGIIQLDTGVFRQWNVIMSGSLIATAPVIALFLLLQKYYISGLASGAVKS